jgi:hypothetical protein
MTVKERLAQIIEALPEEKAEGLLEYAEQLARPLPSVAEIVRDIEDLRKLNRDETPEETFARIGPWEDDRTAEEIIADIHAHRTSSAPVNLL